MRVELRPAGIHDLTFTGELSGGLEAIAQEIAARVDAPADQDITTRSGTGPLGDFAQVIMTGPGALAIEFGTRRQLPKAPLRKALGTIFHE